MLSVRKIGITGLALLALLSRAAAADLRFAGTDLLGAEFSQAMHLALVKDNVAVAAVFDGSRPAAKALQNGRADVALVTLPESEMSALQAFAREPLAYHVLSVIVPADCPLREVSLPQLAALFGERSGARATSWGDLGVTGEWQTAPVQCVAPETGAGVVLEHFRHVALGGAALKSNVARYRNESELRTKFGGDPRAMALVAVVPEGWSNVRVLPVSRQLGGAAMLPTPEAVHAGNYPLSLALWMFVRREQLERTSPLVRWLRSDGAAAAFGRAGLVSVPAAQRAQRRDEGKPRETR